MRDVYVRVRVINRCSDSSDLIGETKIYFVRPFFVPTKNFCKFCLFFFSYFIEFCLAVKYVLTGKSYELAKVLVSYKIVSLSSDFCILNNIINKTSLVGCVTNRTEYDKEYLSRSLIFI